MLYLDRAVLGDGLVGAAVDRPELADPLLRQRVHELHEALGGPGRPAEALAAELRELLDARLPDGVTLEEAAVLLGAHPASLVRAFGRQFGIPPHRYLTGRRVELARRHLLAGVPPAQAAVLAGFPDQPHLTRHLRSLLGVTPAAYARP